MVGLGIILVLGFFLAMAIVIWDFDQSWEDMYENTNWDLTDDE